MKIRTTYQLRSGALQFAVLIAVLIALLLASLILYAYTFTYFKEQSRSAINNIQVADNGIAYLLKDGSTDADTLSLPGRQENQSAKLKLSQWGIFELAYAKASYKKKMFQKSAIVGSKITSETPVLVLQETFTPLSLVGQTIIKGTAMLPLQGVRPGFIASESYHGAQLIYGTIKNSGNGLPEPNGNCLAGLSFYLDSYKPVNADDYIGIREHQKAVYSFHKKTKGAYSKTAIVLSNITISGNVVIKSDTLIRIRNNTSLKDVLIVAPIVEIEDGTNGNFQVIASKQIHVGKSCRLSYPSALVLVSGNKSKTTDIDKNQIFIDSESFVNGTVCYLLEDMDNFKTAIVLEKQARIKGQVYCKGNFELKGTVSGSVYTKQFICHMAGSVFVNHIFNGTIENENMPELYGGMLFEKESKTIIKWLY